MDARENQGSSHNESILRELFLWLESVSNGTQVKDCQEEFKLLKGLSKEGIRERI